MTISRMQEPRQLYGLGSLVKSIAKGVKGAVKGVAKAAKSPLGKAAILGIGAFGLPGGAFGIKGLLPQTSALRSIPTNLLFGRERGVIPGERTGGITSALKNMFTKPSTLGSTLGVAALGTGVAAALQAAGVDTDNPNEIPQDVDALKSYLRSGYMKLNPDAGAKEVEEFVSVNTSEYATGGRVGLAEGTDMKMASMEENEKEFMRLVEELMERGFTQQEAIDEAKQEFERKAIATGGRVGLMGGSMPTGIMRTNQAGIMERDYRETGGFVPVGIKEKADDVPAMLSKNEFVMTADAVRGMGDGNIEKGAQRLYNQMKKLENKIA